MTHSGIAHLGAVGINGSRTVDLAQFAFHVGEAQTHVSGMLVWENLISEEQKYNYLFINSGSKSLFKK